MKRLLVVFIFLLFIFLVSASTKSNAQCSICAKTSQQMGEKPAKGFNSGIIYLMLTPFAVIGYVGYTWWKSNKDD